jgi:hypothetical protein
MRIGSQIVRHPRRRCECFVDAAHGPRCSRVFGVDNQRDIFRIFRDADDAGAPTLIIEGDGQLVRYKSTHQKVGY